MTVGETEGQNYRKLPQYVAALSAAGGALAAGTVLGWTSPTQLALVTDKEYGFEISEETFSWISSAMTLGAAAVCIPIGLLINLIGRKPTMLMLVLPFTIGWALIIWAANVPMMLIGRILVGIAGGAFCVTAPMYTGEIASKEIRGILGSFFQLMVTIGILFAYVVGHGVNVFTLSIICAIIPIVFGIIFFFMPESPLYLVTKDKMAKATKSIKWLRGDEYDHTAELADLQQQIDEIRSQPVSLMAAMRRRATLRALVISMGLMFFQQTCGINAVIFYTTSIFEAANTGIEPGIGTIISGAMGVLGTLLSVFAIDRFGRRVLLLTSMSVMCVSICLLGVYFFLEEDNRAEGLGWLPILCLSFYNTAFALGIAPVPWLMNGELFSPEVRATGSGMATMTTWVLASVITKTFPNLTDALGTPGTFWLFSAFALAGVLFIVFIVPETKGKSLVEIQQMLK